MPDLSDYTGGDTHEDVLDPESTNPDAPRTQYVQSLAGYLDGQDQPRKVNVPASIAPTPSQTQGPPANSWLDRNLDEDSAGALRVAKESIQNAGHDYLFGEDVPESTPNPNRQKIVNGKFVTPTVISSADAVAREAAMVTQQLLAKKGQEAYADRPTDEQAAKETMVLNARQTIAQGGPPDQIEAAKMVLKDHLTAQSDSINRTEQNRASASLGPADYMKRVVELKQRGFDDHAVAQIMAAGQWDSKDITPEALDHLEGQIDLLNSTGQFDRARNLRSAKVAMLKQGLGSIDTNITPADVMYDAAVRYQGQTASWWDAFSLHGVNAMQSSTNAIRRLIGVLPPQSQEKTTIEQLADATEDNHKWAGMAGDFAGGFVDPIFFALNAVTGGVGGKAVSAAAKSARLTELLGNGILPAIAEKEAAGMTLESWAQNSISKWLERKGIQTPAVNSALTRILWNQASAAPIMAGQSALVASAEPTMSPAEKGLAVARGTGQGVLMGFALSGLHIGLESGVSGTRKLAMSIMGRAHPDLPAPVSKAFENALDYAQNGMHADSVKVDLEKGVQVLADAKSALKRPLSGGEAEQVLDAHGINLEHFRNLKPETNDDLIQAGAQIEHRLNDPAAQLKSEERAALTDQHEKIQDMLKRRGELPEPKVEPVPESPSPGVNESGAPGAGITEPAQPKTDDSALLGRLREMDQVASQSGRMPPELAAEHRQLLGEVASRGLSSEYRLQAAKASGGSPSFFQSQKWASTRESLLRDAGRRAEGTDKLTPAPEGAPNVESAAKVVSKDEIMAQVRKDHPDSADAVESIVGMHKGDFVLANVHSSKFKVDLPTGDAATEGISKGKLNKYAKMEGKEAPPVVAVTDPNAPGKLFIADGQHRVLASMLRERQGKGDGSVMAYVPKEWAESSAEQAKAPPQTPRLSPSGPTIPHPSVRPAVMELGSEEIAGGGYKPDGKPFSSRRLAEAKAEVLNKAGADAVISKDGDYWKVHTRENTPEAVKVRGVEDALKTEQKTARTDELTGIGNRVKEKEDIARIYAEADKRGEHVGVVETDLANFKVVNDQLGHDVGDQILKAEGQAIQEAIRMEATSRPNDYAGLTEAGVVNRVGGDEFPIKLRNVSDPARADEIMHRVNDVFRKKVEEIVGDKLPKEAYPFISWGAEIRKPNDARAPEALTKAAEHKVIPNKQAMKAKLGIPETREELTGFIERRKADNRQIRGKETEVNQQTAGTEVPRGTESPRSAKGERSSEAPPLSSIEPVKGQRLKLDLPGRNFPLEGHYAVVSARDAIPSHDARSGFEPNKHGDINERDYRDPTEGKALRENVFRMRDRLNPSLLHTDTPSATDGPPIVTPGLVSLGGNARTMLQQLVYHEGGEKADFLKSTVRQAAKKFGIDPADIAHIDDPMIVRMIKQEHAGEPGELSRLLNQSFTAAKTSDTEAVSRGRKITLNAGNKIASMLEGDTSLSDVFGNRKDSDTLLGHLVETGAMNRDDLIGLTDRRGLLNQQGRKVVENLMLGSAIPDIRRLAETPPQLRGTLIKSIPAILKLRANPIEGQAKFDTTLGNALDALKEYRDSGAGSLHDMVEQQSMLPQPWRKDTNALGLAEAMLEDTPSQLVRKLDQLANQSADANSGQMSLGGEANKPTFESVFPYSGPSPAESGAMFGGSMADMGRTRRGTSYDGGSSPYVPMVKISGNASEHFRDAINPVPMPELVKLARALGVDPTITSLAKIGSGAKGLFNSREMKIQIDPNTALNPYGLAKTLAHEIGHLIDYLDDKVINRGNVLGRVASLKPILSNLRTLHGFMQNTFSLAKATNAELKKELIDLSQFWKPFDRIKSPPEYVKYRDSSQELYADAMSVFLNSPGLLDQKAPKFYAEFSRFIDQKPTVKKAILDIQDLLSGKTEDVIAVRRADSREDYATADQIWKIRAQEARVGQQNVLEWAQQMFMDKATPIINREKAAALAGIPAAERHTAQMAMEELALRDNVSRAFYSEVQRDFHEPIINGEIATRDDIGDYLKFKRIAEGDRQAFGNPGGHTPETAKQMLEDQARIMGPEKWAQLEAGVQTLHDKYHALVERAVEEGIYSDKVLESTLEKGKDFYAPFAVIDHLEDHVGHAIMQQIGTFKGIANPYDALLMKAHSLIRATELNRAKRIAVHDGIMQWFPGEVTLHQTAPGINPPKAKAGFEHLPFMVDGRLAHLEVDQYIAKAFQNTDIGGLNRLAGLVSKPVYATLHPLYVTYSMAFAQANVLRDFKRTFANLSAALGEKVTLGEMLSSYWKNRDVAWRRATEQYDPLVEQMFKERALGARWSAYNPTEELVGAEKLFQEAGLSEKKDFLNRLGEIFKPAEQVLRIADWPLKKVREVVDFTEALPKISAYTILAEKGIDPQRRAYLVRNYVGTPNTMRRGLATNISNGLFMYSNVNVQALRADLGLALNPKTAGAWWLRSMFSDFIPKMAMRAATLGAFGAGVKALYDMVPDYDMAKFTIIPLGTVTGDDGKERVRYVRIPHEDTHRLLASVTWKLSEGQPAAAFSELVGQLPFNPNPYLAMGSKWLQYLQGQNPTDDFRNRPIIEANAFKAGGVPALAGMAHWTANQFGTISTIYNSFQGEPGNPRQTSTSERIIGSAQAISGVSAWLKTSDRGMSEKKWADVDMQEAEKARFKLGLPENTKALLMDRYRLNRLLGAEKKDFAPSDRQRLGVLNQWYSDVYLPVTKQMKALQEAKRTADFEKAKANLQTMTDQALQRSRAKPAPTPSKPPGRN